MAVGFIWGIGAGVLAIAAGGFIADGLSRSVKRKQVVVSMLSDGWSSKIRMVLMRGIPPLSGISRRLLRIEAVSGSASRAKTMLEEVGYGSKRTSLVSLLVATVFGSFLLTTLVSSSAVFGVASGCIVVMCVGG